MTPNEKPPTHDLSLNNGEGEITVNHERYEKRGDDWIILGKPYNSSPIRMFNSRLHEALDEIVRLRAAAQGGEDTRRLDWLDMARTNGVKDGNGRLMQVTLFVQAPPFTSLRKAIDAAMNQPNVTRRSPDHGEG